MSGLVSRLAPAGNTFSWRDALDILVVALVVYALLLLIRGTRAVPMLVGIFAILVVYEAARWMRLVTVRTVLETILFYLPLAVIVLFAHELRRALATFGRTPFFSAFDAEETVSDIVLAATSLSGRRVGALIVLERREGLKTYIENGIPLDAKVSYDLLVTLFAPGTALHDGAVIVSGERIAAAACFLPLSLQEGLAKRFGTRHRAGIGITEETDALAVVVSEERGTISVARGGKLVEDVDAKALRDMLLTELSSSR